LIYEKKRGKGEGKKKERKEADEVVPCLSVAQIHIPTI
tara:strand:- start:34 stop:147 length:114 start_codon:yes stop_codon:yes gene_type:complete